MMDVPTIETKDKKKRAWEERSNAHPSIYLYAY